MGQHIKSSYITVTHACIHFSFFLPEVAESDEGEEEYEEGERVAAHLHHAGDLGNQELVLRKQIERIFS